MNGKSGCKNFTFYYIMKNILFKVVPILALLILLFILFFYFNGSQEAMTNQEAGSILPVIYDSSLSSKTKITDLLGIPVNDASYNQILNSNSKDSDAIIANIKNYIGSSVTFNTTNSGGSGSDSDSANKNTLAGTQPINSNTSLNNSAPTDATTTQPTPLKVNHKSYSERIAAMKKNDSTTTK